MRIGLFFGSFNPIHIGHLIIAEHLASSTALDRVWLVVSPHNPLKERSSLAPDRDRLHWVRLSIEENPKLWASDIEFSLPKPSFTIDTLAYLKEKYPQHTFVLIMGGDSWASLPKWKNYEIILRDYEILIYNRPGSEIGNLHLYPKASVVDAPLLSISASWVRERLQNNLSIRYLVPEIVASELEKHNPYRIKG